MRACFCVSQLGAGVLGDATSPGVRTSANRSAPKPKTGFPRTGINNNKEEAETRVHAEGLSP